MTTRSLGAHTIVGVLGAGSMGTGIAQVAATAGHAVVVTDANGEALARAEQTVRKALARDVDRGRLTEARAQQLANTIGFVRPTFRPDGGLDLQAFSQCGLV